MIYFFTPYSFDKKLFEAWNMYMNLIDDPQDWACMMDGDVAFFRNDFGHHIQKYIDLYPTVSIFSCYASRSGTQHMMIQDNQFYSKNILVHATKAEEYFKLHNTELTILNKRVTGHLMVVQKKTWIENRDAIKLAATNRTLLGIDAAICDTILRNNSTIALMQGLYVFHYYRHLKGYKDRSHLL